MGLLTGALFVGWRHQKRRARTAQKMYNNLYNNCDNLLAELFCCDHCDWCGDCGPENLCLGCFTQRFG